MSSQSNWRPLRLDVVLALHEAQLAEHGGKTGINSREQLDACLATPQSLAAYAIAFVRKRPFVDGNKRTGWVAMRTFLELNGITLTFSPAAAVTEVMALAAGERDDEAFTAWVLGCAQP